jgi:methyl-accepting chemotaxis protein
MTFNFTIRLKLITLSLIALVFTSVVGGTGYWLAAKLGSAKDEIMNNLSVVKIQFEAKQARDALNSDVRAAILAGTQKDQQQIDDLAMDAKNNSKIFLDSVNSLEAAQVNINIKQEVAKVRPHVETYLKSVTTFIGLASSNTDAALARFSEMTTAFKSLDDQMGQLSKLIEDSTNTTQSSASTDFARNIILGVTVSAWIILLAFAFFVARSIIHHLSRAVEIADAVAGGDLTQRIEVTSRDEVGQLLQALKGMNHSLADIVGEVRNTTDMITTAAKEIAQGNSDLSQRTEQQASSLEETASSMEELTSTVKQNAENAMHANQLAATASEIAVKGGHVVDQVVGTMASINTSSKKIVDIISVIEGIAFQTNILALNAAVEAARAGEQGRGFAVVAAEVRNLAQRSAAAAKEIKALIVDSVSKVDVGAKQVDEAGATMQEIVQAVKHVTDIVAEITAASNEQSSGIEEVNQAIVQMDDVTQQNAALVEEAAAAAESMQSQLGALNNAVSIFKLNSGNGGLQANVSRYQAKPLVAQPSSLAPQPVPARRERKLVKAVVEKDEDWREF